MKENYKIQLTRTGIHIDIIEKLNEENFIQFHDYVMNFLSKNDMKKLFPNGFILCADLRKLGLFSGIGAPILKDLQTTMIKLGVKKSAKVLDKGMIKLWESMLKNCENRIKNEKLFTTKGEALEWLYSENKN